MFAVLRSNVTLVTHSHHDLTFSLYRTHWSKSPIGSCNGLTSFIVDTEPCIVRELEDIPSSLEWSTTLSRVGKCSAMMEANGDGLWLMPTKGHNEDEKPSGAVSWLLKHGLHLLFYSYDVPKYLYHTDVRAWTSSVGQWQELRL